METSTRPCPEFSACHLNCGLCPRYHTEGSSRCPGCAGEGFAAVHPPCGVLSCTRRHGIDFCDQCGEFPCKKYDGAEDNDSFITHRNMFRDAEKAKAIGIDAYRAELDEKIGLLRELLEHYNDGRRKSFYCTAVNLLELEDVRTAMAQIREQAAAAEALTAKERAAMAAGVFQDLANERGVSLKLRKKAKA